VASGSDTQRRSSVLAILGPIDRIGAVEVYRITAPLTHLHNQNRYQCHWMPVTGVKELLERKDSSVFHHDIVILHKVLTDNEESGKKLIESLRTFGARVIYETDDDYSGIYRPADTTKPGTWNGYIRNVDAVTVSTSYLGKLAHKASGKPVHVCPNSINVDWYAGVSRKARDIYPDNLTFMVCGTQTHGGDWRVLETVIPHIVNDHPNVTFLAGGFCPEYLDDLVEYLPGVQYTEYPSMLRQADVLLCPLDPDDRFNWSKSNVKALEGWAAERQGPNGPIGCAVIATRGKSYNGTVQNRNNGLLVNHTPEAWERAIRQLIEDSDLRIKLAKKGLKDVRKKYDSAKNWVYWDRAYRSILSEGG